MNKNINTSKVENEYQLTIECHVKPLNCYYRQFNISIQVAHLQNELNQLKATEAERRTTFDQEKVLYCL